MPSAANKRLAAQPPAFSAQSCGRSPAPATTMKSAPSTACIAVAVATPAPVGIRSRPVISATIVSVSAASVVAIPGASVVTVAAASPVTIAGPVIAVVPRARANKDAARKPLRSVVSIRRTRVWIIRVVAISACGRWSDITRADSNSHRNLRLRISRRQYEDAQQSQIP